MIQDIHNLQRLDYLISTGTAGTRKNLSEKFGVSQRTISRWLETMNNNGACIIFCRLKKSFKYAEPGNFVVQMEFKKKLVAV